MQQKLHAYSIVGNKKYFILKNKKPHTKRTGLLNVLKVYFFLSSFAGAAFAAVAGAGAAVVGVVGAAASSCFNCRVRTTDATEIRGEFKISISSALISCTRMLPFNSRFVTST